MWLISGVTAVFLVVLDHITKYIALTQLKPIGSKTVISGFFDFTYVENRGAAFGMLSGQRWFFVLLTIVVSAVIVYAFIKMPKNKEYVWLRTALILVLSGAVGNMIDRIIRGYVVDFLEITLIRWPVFNLADIYVVAGTALLLYLAFFVIKEEPKKEENAEEK